MPEDYAIMTMATIFTGYAAMFSELGLGAAIVQKKNINDKEISSVFWIGFIFSMFFGLACFLLAYPTALVFGENRLIPITQTVSVIFFINGLVIVPANILRKRMKFKQLGFIEMTGVIISSACMLCIAYAGGGVWTFIGGHIIRDVVKAILYYRITLWRPFFHFVFSEARQYLQFGLAVSIGNSFKYMTEKSDRFFAGIFWSAEMLGLYSFANQLSALPNQKISSIVNQVSFSALSKLQDSKDQFVSLYFQLTKIIFSLVIPLYLGGFWVGSEIFKVILGPKWVGAILFFRLLCIVQLLKSFEPINYQIHAAQGRARLYFMLRAIIGTLLPITFFFCIKFGGVYGIIIPWFTTYLIFQIVLVILALKWLRISPSIYFRNLAHPICAGFLMSMVLYIYQKFINVYGLGENNLVFVMVAEICISAFIYISYFIIFDKQLISSIRNLKNM